MAPGPFTITDDGYRFVDTSTAGLDASERYLAEAGFHVRPLDVAPFASRFAQYCALPEYAGTYRKYPGSAAHCLREKALEHFLSFELLHIQPGMTGMDVGSAVSVVPQLLRHRMGCVCYEQDLGYAPGVNGMKVGSLAGDIPLPDACLDFAVLHCAYDHFEHEEDTRFVYELARLLKPRPTSGAVIIPLYLNTNYVNITGVSEPARQDSIGFDHLAQHHCLVTGWDNRFGRFYSPAALVDRVLNPAQRRGLKPCIHRVHNWQTIDDKLWIRWVLTFSVMA